MAGADRISELPEFILHRILSSLSHKQAIQTSALSKPWRHVGPTGPKIELRESCFKKSGRASFLSVLRKTLQRYHHRNLSVHEFILEMSSGSKSKSDHQVIDSESRSVLHKAIPMLLTNMGVKKFEFSVPNYVVAPSFVFRAEFLTELCLSECKFMSTNDRDLDQPLFKGLKRLSLNKVHIQDETLEKIVHSCSLIEYLLVSGCVGLKTIPVIIFQTEFLTELHLTGCSFFTERHLKGPNLIVTTPSSTDLLLINRLKMLSLDKVNILDKTLEKIMRSCPLIETVLLTDCVGLKNIQLNKFRNNNNLKHFSGSFERVGIKSIEIDAPTIETIRIVQCPNWYGHDKYPFPLLKSLYLSRIRLSEELFKSFSSNFPSLEELELQRCYGFSEIQLTVCSIKRLVLIIDSIKRIKATIYAPNIHYFEISAHFPPQLIFHTETAREWNSHVVMLFNQSSNDKVSMLPWLLQLSELLNSLRESQISLNVCPNPFKNLKVEDTNDPGFCKPVPLAHVHVKGGVSDCNRYSSFPDFVNCLFLICRPRYIGMNWYITNSETDWEKEKNKLAEYIIFKIIRNQGEMSRGHLWEKDLDEISMQVCDANSQGWHTVCVEGTSFSGFTSTNLRIRFPLKWRD